MKTTVSTKRTLIVSLIVDAVDLVSSVVVAIITGSAIILAEALQGLADLISVGLLLIGHQRSTKRADRYHQFGYGKEIYFWTLLAAVIILLITSTLSISLGVFRLLHPQHVEWTILAYLVLIVALVSNSYAFVVSARRLLGGRPVQQLAEAYSTSPLLAPKTTATPDAMGSLAALLGLANLSIYSFTGDARFDGMGAIFIGGVLILFATILLVGLRGFVTGRSVSPELARQIRQVARGIPGVTDVLDLRTMLLGSSNTLVIIDVHLQDRLNTDQIEIIIDQIQHAVGEVVPGKAQVQVEIESPKQAK